MMVIRIAMTPSLNASRRVLDMDLPQRPRVSSVVCSYIGGNDARVRPIEFTSQRPHTHAKQLRGARAVVVGPLESLANQQPLRFVHVERWKPHTPICISRYVRGSGGACPRGNELREGAAMAGRGRQPSSAQLVEDVRLEHRSSSEDDRALHCVL